MSENVQYRPFLQIAAVCSLLGAITTAILLFLPGPAAADFDEQLQLHQNTRYLTKLWVLFLHPQVNIIASAGVAVLLWKRYSWQMILGLGFLLVWAYTEMSQQALLIDSLNQLWRPAYLEAGDEATQALYKTLIEGASGLSDSHYFLVIYGFGLGSLFYGLALVQEPALGKALGIAMLFIGLVSLCSFGRYYLGLSFLNDPVNWSYRYIYTWLQPLVRVALAVWIWLAVKKRAA